MSAKADAGKGAMARYRQTKSVTKGCDFREKKGRAYAPSCREERYLLLWEEGGGNRDSGNQGSVSEERSLFFHRILINGRKEETPKTRRGGDMVQKGAQHCQKKGIPVQLPRVSLVPR